MKNKRIFRKCYVWLMIPAIVLSSCNKEETLTETNANIEKNAPANEIDAWIRETFTPYNIDILYRWNENQTDLGRTLFPPDPDKLIPVLEVIKQAWIEPYSKIGGPDFIKITSPRQIVLIGGKNINPNGTTVTLGLAENGARVTLFEVNQINTKDRTQLMVYLKTLHHEYTHILNQTRPYNPAFGKINPEGYTANWYDFSNNQARAQGFITAYAKTNDVEDFAEMTSEILTHTKTEFDDIVNGINNQVAKSKIRSKEQILVDYFKQAWNIDLYALQAEVNTQVDNITN